MFAKIPRDICQIGLIDSNALEARTPHTQVPETFLSIYILSRMTSTRAKSPEK